MHPKGKFNDKDYNFLETKFYIYGEIDLSCYYEDLILATREQPMEGGEAYSLNVAIDNIIVSNDEKEYTLSEQQQQVLIGLIESKFKKEF